MPSSSRAGWVDGRPNPSSIVKEEMNPDWKRRFISLILRKNATPQKTTGSRNLICTFAAEN